MLCNLNNKNMRKGYDFRFFKFYNLNSYSNNMFYLFALCPDFKNLAYLITKGNWNFGIG